MASSRHQILRDAAGREVVKFVLPSGGIGIVATCIPAEALDKIARELRRDLERLERRLAAAKQRSQG